VTGPAIHHASAWSPLDSRPLCLFLTTLPFPRRATEMEGRLLTLSPVGTLKNYLTQPKNLITLMIVLANCKLLPIQFEAACRLRA
jgi:hypothetical protein